MHIFSDQPSSSRRFNIQDMENSSAALFSNFALKPKQTHRKRSWSSWPILSLVVQIKYSPLARPILLRECHRGHQWWQGPLIVGRNWCQMCCSILLQLARTVSHRREACVIKSPSKALVIIQEIDSEIEKVCGHEDSPSPTSTTPRFL